MEGGATMFLFGMYSGMALLVFTVVYLQLQEWSNGIYYNDKLVDWFCGQRANFAIALVTGAIWPVFLVYMLWPRREEDGA